MQYVDINEYQKRLEAIQGAQRFQKLRAETAKLTQETRRADAEEVKAARLGLTVEIEQEGYNQTDFKLQAARVGTAIEETHLRTARLDLGGYDEEYGLKEQGWQLKLEGHKARLEQAAQMLAEFKAMGAVKVVEDNAIEVGYETLR